MASLSKYQFGFCVDGKPTVLNAHGRWATPPIVIAHKQAVRARLNEWWARAVRPAKRPMTQIEAMKWAVETALGGDS